MNKDEQIKNTLKEFRLPTYEEIPDVGLYLDQVTKYINSYLENFSDMKVTPSMISNYVKLKLISKATKKTYSREQVAGFIFIVFSKTVLSMNHIQHLLELQKDKYEISVAYNYFRNELLNALNSFYETRNKEMNRNSTEEKRMLHTVVVTIAHKMYLECYFEDID